MTGGQHGEKLCWRIDFKGPIPVEKGLRAAVALGKLCGRPARQEGKMAVIRPEWAIANPLAPGPDAYAPPDRRAPEDPPSGVAFLRGQTGDRSQSNEGSARNLDALIRRIAGTSMDEIDSVIRELEGMREMLRDEGERVSREIAGYAGLSQASMSAMQVISDSLRAWKGRTE
jgi:hypothetical protein